MKRLLLFLLLASGAFGQMSSTGSITTNASNCFTTNVCIVMNLFNSPALQTVSTAIQVSGTWTGTLSFEASVDGVTFVALPAGPVAGGATVTSTTANGTWVANIQALNVVRVRGSAAMTGAAVVLLQASANGNSIPFPQYAVASLPTNLPIGTLAVATDSNAGSCTVGSSTALALCRWSGSAWVALSSGGGGSGTVTNTGGALTLNAVMLGAGGSDSKVDTALSTDAAGAITDAQGSTVTSKPNTFTQTWNAAGVAFTHWLQNITCTAAATASIAQGLGVAGTTWQFKFNGATCTNPQFIVPNGSAGNPSIASASGTTTGLAFTGSQVQIVASGTSRVFVDTRLLTAVPIADSGTGNSQLNFAAGLITVQGTGVPNFGFNQGKGQHFVTQAANNDMAGTCTFVSTTCTVTFTTAYTVAPSCTVNDQTAAAPVRSAPTTTNVVFTGGTGAGTTDVVNYICVGNPN